MVIVMEHAASEEQVQRVIESLVEVGYDVHRSSGVDFTVLGAVGVPHRPMDPRLVEVLPGVREVIRVSEPYKLAGRTFKAEDTVVDVAGVKVGATEVIAMAGPCSVESAEQVGAVAKSVAASGARILRGGAFKPRTSPYSFQGYGEEALKWMRAAADASGMAVISEVMDPRQIEMMMATSLDGSLRLSISASASAPRKPCAATNRCFRRWSMPRHSASISLIPNSTCCPLIKVPKQSLAASILLSDVILPRSCALSGRNRLQRK